MGRTPAGVTRQKVYRFVCQRIGEGNPPTVREVRDQFGFRAVQTAREHLERLVSEGRLAKVAGRARGYRLPGPSLTTSLPTTLPTTLVPVLGRVSAGPLDVAVEDLEGYVPTDGHADFGLRVHGESMRDIGILSGDLVLVRAQETARSGEIVVALVGDEATVKVLRRFGRRVELWPANDAFTPIRPAPDEFRLLGKVIEVRRYL